jgi:hypothetical protein
MLTTDWPKTTTDTPVDTSQDGRVRRAVSTHFAHRENGFMYPGFPERSLVRASIYEGQLRIERRRKLHTAWMPISTRDTAEFSESDFVRWMRTWPLSA